MASVIKSQSLRIEPWKTRRETLTLSGDERWYVARSLPRKEARAEFQLLLQGFRSFLPRMTKTASSRTINMNPMDEFKKLTSLFHEEDELFAHVEHIPATLTPEPYKQLLVHDRHMTLTMEEFHRSPVVVNVLDRKLEGNLYSRKILLKRSDDGAVVQFALVRFDLSVVLPAVRDEILSEQTPLGRILVNYNVFRVVDLGAILQITAGPAFARLCGCSIGQLTYGRLATIFCNGRPAVDLFEAVAR